MHITRHIIFIIVYVILWSAGTAIRRAYNVHRVLFLYHGFSRVHKNNQNKMSHTVHSTATKVIKFHVYEDNIIRSFSFPSLKFCFYQER